MGGVGGIEAWHVTPLDLVEPMYVFVDDGATLDNGGGL